MYAIDQLETCLQVFNLVVINAKMSETRSPNMNFSNRQWSLIIERMLHQSGEKIDVECANWKVTTQEIVPLGKTCMNKLLFVKLDHA